MPRIYALVLLLTLMLPGCSNLGYYSQAVGGHLEVMRVSRPIKELVEDPHCEPGLKKRLEEVHQIREFASRQLGLPDNDSYRSYADLQRPYVTWNVFAAPEFSLKAEKWCMLIVGCVSYRGFFSQSEAEMAAQQLRQQGFDVYVGGVPAYSTLGFFSDPVLNTFIASGNLEVARLVFHELAHQMVYVEGDTAFNESFATLVENEGLRRWLEHQGNQKLAHVVDDRRQQKAAFVELVNSYRAKLHDIYASDLPVDTKRSAKAEVMRDMQRAYLSQQKAHGKPPVYKQWLEKDLNNAKIASLALYTKHYPAFNTLLDEEGGSLPAFYERVKILSGLPVRERNATFKKLSSPVQLNENHQLAEVQRYSMSK